MPAVFHILSDLIPLEAESIKATVADVTGQQLELTVQEPKQDDAAGSSAGGTPVSPEVELVKKVFKGEIV